MKPVTWSPSPGLPTCSSADGRAQGNGQAEGEERRQHADGRTDHGASLQFAMVPGGWASEIRITSWKRWFIPWLIGFNHPFGGAGFRNHPQYINDCESWLMHIIWYNYGVGFHGLNFVHVKYSSTHISN